MYKNYNKNPLTFKEQIDILKSRGMIFDDKNSAIIDLQKIGYYRLSAYWYPFRVNKNNQILDNFQPNINWNKIIQIYEFDRKLRLLVLDAIERFEVQLRTKITYNFSHKYGAFGYLDKNNFHNKFKYQEWIKNLNKETERNKSIFIKHFHKNHPNQSIPIWMVTEIMSFGSLSRMYQGMNQQDQKMIYFGIHRKRLEDWIKILVYIRNICAHHSRLWNAEITIRASKPDKENWGIPNNKIFYILTMLKDLNSNLEWKNKIENLIKTLPNQEKLTQMMGIPKDWQNHKNWK
jgi:abortive infection bacteriophage resistance protein